MIWFAVVLVAVLAIFTRVIVGTLVRERNNLRKRLLKAETACSAVVIAHFPLDDGKGHLLDNAVRLCQDVVDTAREMR